jgi:Zn-finger nucleic acid-binding protein
MECPNKHKEPLRQIYFHNVQVDYCAECLGIWFDKDELRLAKDDKDKQLNWLDFDIWRDKSRFKVSKSKKHCPACRAVLIEIKYEDSKVKIDFCKNCQGIWLDRGEFKQIMVYLRRKADYEILHKYAKNLARELWEVFSGPEKFREELEDFLMLLKLFNYKFAVQHPVLNSMIENSQK